MVTSGVISRVTILITHIRAIRGLITPLLTAHEPPSSWNNQPQSCFHSSCRTEMGSFLN